MTVSAEFSRALDALVAELRHDRSVLAVILAGSLSHDTVWARSDIDLVLVTIDDSRVAASTVALTSAQGPRTPTSGRDEGAPPGRSLVRGVRSQP